MFIREDQQTEHQPQLPLSIKILSERKCSIYRMVTHDGHICQYGSTKQYFSALLLIFFKISPIISDKKKIEMIHQGISIN